MNIKPTPNGLPQIGSFDAIADDAASMAALIPTAASISVQFEIPDSVQPSAAELEASAYLIRTNFIEFNTLSLSLTRKHRLAVLAAATVFKAEALKVDGYLKSAFSKHGVETAANTDSGQALNASIIRLLTTVANQAEHDKWDVSRNATAMTGVEVMCSDNNVDLTFSAVGRVLEVIQVSSRSGLMRLAAERKKDAVSRSTTESLDRDSPQREKEIEPPADQRVTDRMPSEPHVHTSETVLKEPLAASIHETDARPLITGPEPYFKLDAPKSFSSGQTFVAKVIDGHVWFFGPVANGAAASQFI